MRSTYPDWKQPEGYTWNHAGQPGSTQLERSSKRNRTARYAHKGPAAPARAQTRETKRTAQGAEDGKKASEIVDKAESELKTELRSKEGLLAGATTDGAKTKLQAEIAQIEKALTELRAVKSAPVASRWRMVKKMLQATKGNQTLKRAIQGGARLLGYAFVGAGIFFVIRDFSARADEIGTRGAAVEAAGQVAIMANPYLNAVVLVAQLEDEEFQRTYESINSGLKDYTDEQDRESDQGEAFVRNLYRAYDKLATDEALELYQEYAKQIEVPIRDTWTRRGSRTLYLICRIKSAHAYTLAANGKITSAEEEERISKAKAEFKRIGGRGKPSGSSNLAGTVDRWHNQLLDLGEGPPKKPPVKNRGVFMDSIEIAYRKFCTKRFPLPSEAEIVHVEERIGVARAGGLPLVLGEIQWRRV